MPTLFGRHPFRAPLALIAASLLVLQALVAAVAAGQASAAVDPIEAAICHGAGDAAAGGSGAPDRDTSWHLCCDFCISAIAGLAPLAGARAELLEPRPAGRLTPASAFTIVRMPGAVRAGPSQAPPVRVNDC